MTEIVRWWWVRHAPAPAQGFCGWTDLEADLSDQSAIAALRSALPERAALVSSDLRRAADTAAALARKTWREDGASPQLREQNFGAWEGRAYESVGDMAEFWRDPAGATPPGGESFTQVCDRVGRFVLDKSREGDREVIAVAHAGAIRAALALALTLPPAQALSFEIAPLSLTRIDWIAEAKAWRIGAVNVPV